MDNTYNYAYTPLSIVFVANANSNYDTAVLSTFATYMNTCKHETTMYYCSKLWLLTFGAWETTPLTLHACFLPKSKNQTFNCMHIYTNQSQSIQN